MERERRPDVPDPSDTAQIKPLTSIRHQERASEKLALDQMGDNFVADAESVRIDQAANPDDKTSEGRPPHPVNRQALKKIFAAA